MSCRKPTWAKSCAVNYANPHISPGGGMTVLGSCLHRIRASLHIIAQGFGFTGDFTLKGTEA